MRGRVRVRLAATVLATVVAAGCGGPAPTPIVSPSPTPAGSAPVPSLVTPSEPPIVASPTIPLPTLPSVPTGRWTGLRWFSLADGIVPVNPAPYGTSSHIDLFGWSRGYVDFVWDGSHSVLPWASPDGLHWQPGPSMQLGQTPFTLPELDPNLSEWCAFEIDSFVETPAGLLAHGRLVCETSYPDQPGTTLYSGSWASKDGLAWSAASMPDGELSAGGAGFIATDGLGVWVSSNGSTWRSGAPPGPALPEAVRWGHATAFAGGFLLAPETRYTQWPFAANFPAGTPAGVFWSADGKTWSGRDPPGARSGYTELWLDKIADGLVLLREEDFDGRTATYTLMAWTSRDGQVWKPMASWTGYGTVGPGTTVQGTLVPNGDVVTGLGHALVTHFDSGNLLVFYGFDTDTGKLIVLKVAGDVPSLSPAGHGIAIGPRGLLATDDGQHFWIAVPTAG